MRYPVIEKINGVVKFDNEKDKFYEVRINHKLHEIEEYRKKIDPSELGLTIVGKNLFNNNIGGKGIKSNESLLITKLSSLFGIVIFLFKVSFLT